MKQRFPDPHVVATRKALAARPSAPLERVLEQAAASREFIAAWRAKGLPDLPDTLHPNAIKEVLDLPLESEEQRFEPASRKWVQH